MYIYIITQYGNTVYKKFKFAQKNKPDKAFGDFRCQTSAKNLKYGLFFNIIDIKKYNLYTNNKHYSINIRKGEKNYGIL